MGKEGVGTISVLSYDDIKESYSVLLTNQRKKDIATIFQTTNLCASLKNLFGELLFTGYQSIGSGLGSMGFLSLEIQSNATADIILQQLSDVFAIPAEKIKVMDTTSDLSYTIRTGPTVILNLKVQKPGSSSVIIGSNNNERDTTEVEFIENENEIAAKSSNAHVIHDHILHKIKRFSSLGEIQTTVPKSNYKKAISFYVPVEDPFEDALKNDIIQELSISPKDIITVDDLNKRTIKYNHPTSKYRIFIYLCSEAEPIDTSIPEKIVYKTKYRTPKNSDTHISNYSIFGDNSYDKRMAGQIPTVGYSLLIDNIALGGISHKTGSLVHKIPYDTYSIKKETIRESFMDPITEEHKLNPFTKIGNVWYINDSKSTSLNAAWYALESLPGPMIWIVGGVNKGTDLAQVQDALGSIPKDKIHSIIYIGVEKDFLYNLQSVLKGSVDTFFSVDSMQHVAHLCHQLTQAGQCTDIKTVVLSPGCASFDRFENFEDRGRKFMHAVRDKS